LDHDPKLQIKYLTRLQNCGIMKKIRFKEINVKNRYLSLQIKNDLKSKMVFLGGPRQVGKTTLSKNLFPNAAYLNWDYSEDRELILRNELPSHNILIFDEIHKYKKWRNYLKGFYDKNKNEKRILVTGSARLDFYRYGGDSLQGRYHFLRLHPLTFDELNSTKWSDFESLFQFGGFPEPFFKGNKIEAQRWSREYRQRILRDDISSIERISDLGSAEHLLIRLPELVGSPLSINSLAEDLQISFKTIKRWLEVFERFYAFYRISAMGSPKIKAIKKEQKHYHYDWTLVKNPGLKFENLIGNHLLKRVQFLEDTQGRDIELRFYKDRESREVDFVIVEDQQATIFIECKLSDTQVSPHLKYVKSKFPNTRAYQLTFNSKKDFTTPEGIRVCDAWKILTNILDELNNPKEKSIP
jgi:predicted AAA+ superfamily ATPase